MIVIYKLIKELFNYKLDLNICWILNELIVSFLFLDRYR